MKVRAFKDRVHAFTAGAGSVLDLSGGLDFLEQRRQTDNDAIREYWICVGEDIERAQNKLEGQCKVEESRQLELALK